VGKVLRSIGWLWQSVFREVLLQLASHDFQKVCPEVQEVARCMTRGLAGTVVNERCFRSLSDAKDLNKNHKVSRQRRYSIPW
jgi:hypothetical protein